MLNPLYRSEIKIRPVYHIRNDSPADEVPEEQDVAQSDQPRHSILMQARHKYNNDGGKK